MFSESKVASSFQLSKTKCGYFITYGFAPHFKELLLKDVNLSPFFVLSFDESLNEVIQKEQMDLQICHCDNTQKKFCTRYLSSYFLQCPNAKNLCDVLISSLKELIPEHHSVHPPTPPPPSFLQGGDLFERGRGFNFYVKKKKNQNLKYLMTKNIDRQKCFSLSQLRIQIEKF